MSENLIQAVLHRQGRKALKGETEDKTDVEVRRKGLSRIARRGILGTVITGGVTAIVAHAIGAQNNYDAAVVRADKAAAPKVGDPFPGATSPSEGSTSSEDSTGAATASGAMTGGEAAPAPTTSEDDTAASGDTTVPAQGAWQPSPGAQPAPTSTEVGTASQGPTGGVGAEAPQDHTGGLSSQQ